MRSGFWMAPSQEAQRGKRVVFVLAAVFLASLMLGGVALAAEFTGTRNNDVIRGTGENDTMYGLSGDDQLFGRGDPDELYGGKGSDNLRGGPDGDELYGGTGNDDLFGGGGNDYINSADSSRPDLVDCGDGINDRAVVDDEDNVFDCEDVQTVL
jgi:Ca2+-binding RTX toxin-like protein